jgi:hypothetical protein
MHAVQLEREVAHHLPALIAELFDEPAPPRVETPAGAPDGGIDVLFDDGRGRRLMIQAKASSGPGVVARAAEHFAAAVGDDAIPVLVVPYMTAAGAKAAAERDLNWIDLSGNAHLRDDDLYVWVQGRPNRFVGRGRPSSPFAPKSARVTRAMLLDPTRWWVQKELADHTGLDPGSVSRIVRRLDRDTLVERDASRLRPRDPDLLLDAWAQDYRFDRHDIITGHLSGSGVELARDLHGRLADAEVDHAFTGLAAAWAIDGFARFRLVSVYVAEDPRAAAESVRLRRNERGANVQLIGPDDSGVFDGRRTPNDLPCVSPVQTFLDLGNLPERAAEAAEHLRADTGLWHGRD